MSDFSNLHQDTIVAQATAPGRGGVGIIRVSGSDALRVAREVLKLEPKPRFAHYTPFHDACGQILDEGIALYFPNPNSFTGEDVLELQGHGGPIILDLLLKRILALGVRQANPGEFSERAFLNDKLDLAQAEAIADLIDSTSEQAARSALRSLQGAFSQRVNTLVESLIELRIYVEAAIDFPEEEIDFLNDGKVTGELASIAQQLGEVIREAGQGAILRDGMTVVIAGRPNAGKSSLMNVLAGRDTAIVTDIAGTTRDVLKEHINIDGMPLHVIDTAGLRETEDRVEQIGVERAFKAIEEADRVLLMVDGSSTEATHAHDIWPEFADRLPVQEKLTIIRNKIDLTGEQPGFSEVDGVPVIRLCACNDQKSEHGVDALKAHLKACMGFEGAVEGSFSARRRHLEALRQAGEYIENGRQQLEHLGAGELLAEDLRLAQKALGEITGTFSSDDLLGRIFSSFCIGK
ncbi:tRNA uridine-5-carboxymethylaminomethyl(34) synthesis GTPase MnmE [Endozoicomonas sp. GU-1]|uniref:tRNA uridine-5-carboxymethylaminomethyl(34) synthesis GTPase MnmE n=1 Tax=Endozoicomonas sp. GU-1 TaxID=3009078 RepID=UPI0022B575DB|nr:tRNA uridine-5-carboxymethylaminomethyl(34) synthesis GTPase MnmE [Endozoicomonas sp. GU-1]WBA81744.1 tRNA uridine-5-carboxymethylaminomethyl(34) synthesis GTPase MnmE [Endozoicomonas sp. GU-1]WBA84699.1 tRNA uridine-5-carboxymethylaminomethyl(34) synthesis GTPase MnmE [Endozoicomonas sp. GU-1]